MSDDEDDLDWLASPGQDASADEESALEVLPMTALEVDQWSERIARDLLKESQLLRSLKLGDAESAVADFFSALHEPEPLLHEQSEDSQRHEFIAALLESSDYAALHESTAMNQLASEIGCVALCQEWAESRAKLQPPPSPDSPPEGQKEERAEQKRQLRVLSAAAKAAEIASKEVEEVESMLDAMGAGMGPGSPGSSMDAAALKALFKRVRSSRYVKRICELAGRYRRVAQSKQKNKVVHGTDDMVGVQTGGDLARLLPSEAVRLLEPDLELDALRKLLERQSLCWEFKGLEPQGKGPILVCVDESGSMVGEKVCQAKALALALVWIANRQKRHCLLVSYSGDTGERLLSIPPDRAPDQTALFTWLEGFIDGGSWLDVPLREIPRYHAGLPSRVKTQADVVMVTDAICHVPQEIREEFLRWKESAQARVFTLIVGDRGDTGDLARISDRCDLIPALSPDGEAIGNVLSL